MIIFKTQPVFNLWEVDHVSSLSMPFAKLAQNSILLLANVNDRQICGVWAHLVRHKHNQRPAVWENKTGSATFLKKNNPHSNKDNANEITYVKLSHETVSPQWIGVIHLQGKKTDSSVYFTHEIIWCVQADQQVHSPGSWCTSQTDLMAACGRCRKTSRRTEKNTCR